MQYINQVHSVTTPADLKKAIESDEGIAGVLVTVVPLPKTTVKTKSIKWEGISRKEILSAKILLKTKNEKSKDYCKAD